MREKLSRLARRKNYGPNDKFANHVHVEHKTSVFLIMTIQSARKGTRFASEKIIKVQAQKNHQVGKSLRPGEIITQTPCAKNYQGLRVAKIVAPNLLTMPT